MNRRRYTAWLLIAALITGVCACGKTEDTAPDWDIFGFLERYLDSYSEGGLGSLIPGLPSGIPGLPSDKNEESAKEAGAPVTMEDGSGYTFADGDRIPIVGGGFVEASKDLDWNNIDIDVNAIVL